ncbi:Holliday junction ATP-dependent DNA helicase RuvA [Campylobacterota bacterium]|nr:Holliday junction ATP-dependent DNA helicase RuvA [Campylobacterota bacterium]
MIAVIEGEIIAKEPGSCVLLTSGGVGYHILVSLNTFAHLTEKRARLLTTLVVREDALLLFGFADDEERRLFALLLKVNGVGPKSALAILSTFTPQQFAKIIAEANETMLTRVPGVGKKTAALMIVQLSGTIGKLDLSGGEAGNNEAFLALESLGFKPAEITKALGKCQATETVQLIKEALKILQKVS